MKPPATAESMLPLGGNFTSLAGQMGMEADAQSAVQTAATDIEQEIEAHYPDADEAKKAIDRAEKALGRYLGAADAADPAHRF